MCYRNPSLNNDPRGKRAGSLLSLLAICAIVASALGLMAMACGCQHYGKASGATGTAIVSADESAAGISEPLVRTAVRLEGIEAEAQKLIDWKLAPEPALYASFIKAGAVAAQGDIQEARHAVDATRTELGTAQTQAAQADEKYTQLRGEWYVTWGLRIERAWIMAKWAFWLAAIVFVVGGVAKDTGLAATPWFAVAIVGYRIVLTVLTGCLYPLILACRWLLAKWYPSAATAALTRTVI